MDERMIQRTIRENSFVLWALLFGSLGLFVVLSQIVYALGWGNLFVADDWGFLTWVANTRELAQFNFFFSFDTGWFVRPMQWVVTYLLYAVFGSSPVPFHIASQALDLFNAFLVGLLVWQLLNLIRRGTVKSNLLFASLAGVFFLLNAPHQEAVFWYAAINELLAACFRLLALNVLVAWFRSGRHVIWTGVAIGVGTILALLSKESSIALPFECLLFAVMLGGLNDPRRRRAVLGILAAQFFILAGWVGLYVRNMSLVGESIGRAGVMILQPSPDVELLRVIAFWNAHFPGMDQIWKNKGLMFGEAITLLVLGVFAIRSRQRLWLLGLAWAVLAVLPYTLIAYAGDSGQAADRLARPVVPDRFLYYSAAALSLWFVSSLLWLNDAILVRLAAPLRKLARGALAVGVALLLVLNLQMLWNAGQFWHAATTTARQALVALDVASPLFRPGQAVCLSQVPLKYKKRRILPNQLGNVWMLYYGREYINLRSFGGEISKTVRAKCDVVLEYQRTENRFVKK